MKQFFVCLVCLFLTGVSSFSQTKKTPVKPVPKPSVIIPVAAVSEIPDPEWNEITKALVAENWEKAALLSANGLKRLTVENDKKQLAALNYFYLYSLAGKIQAKTTTYAEFERVSQAFIGKDFLMPSRQISANCTTKVNYICEVPGDVMTLRVTATNKNANAIHFFEYYTLNDFFDIVGNNRKKAFLSGKLKKLELGLNNGIQVIRLFFEESKVEMVK